MSGARTTSASSPRSPMSARTRSSFASSRGQATATILRPYGAFQLGERRVEPRRSLSSSTALEEERAVEVREVALHRARGGRVSVTATVTSAAPLRLGEDEARETAPARTPLEIARGDPSSARMPRARCAPSRSRAGASTSIPCCTRIGAPCSGVAVLRVTAGARRSLRDLVGGRRLDVERALRSRRTRRRCRARLLDLETPRRDSSSSTQTSTWPVVPGAEARGPLLAVARSPRTGRSIASDSLLAHSLDLAARASSACSSRRSGEHVAERARRSPLEDIVLAASRSSTAEPRSTRASARRSSVLPFGPHSREHAHRRPRPLPARSKAASQRTRTSRRRRLLRRWTSPAERPRLRRALARLREVRLALDAARRHEPDGEPRSTAPSTSFTPRKRSRSASRRTGTEAPGADVGEVGLDPDLLVVGELRAETLGELLRQLLGQRAGDDVAPAPAHAKPSASSRSRELRRLVPSGKAERRRASRTRPRVAASSASAASRAAYSACAPPRACRERKRRVLPGLLDRVPAAITGRPPSSSSASAEARGRPARPRAPAPRCRRRERAVTRRA